MKKKGSTCRGAEETRMRKSCIKNEPFDHKTSDWLELEKKAFLFKQSLQSFISWTCAWFISAPGPSIKARHFR